MVAEVVSIEGRTRPAEVNQSIIDLLERLLTDARNGEIVGIAGVSLMTGGDVATFSSENDSFYKLVGAIEQLKFEMFARHADEG